jgi:hypothetical protein
MENSAPAPRRPKRYGCHLVLHDQEALYLLDLIWQQIEHELSRIYTPANPMPLLVFNRLGESFYGRRYLRTVGADFKTPDSLNDMEAINLARRAE